MIRYIDDFLFITSDKQVAVKFMGVIHEGFPEFGFKVQPSKTLTNFQYFHQNQLLKTVFEDDYGISCVFPWCGLLIDMDTLNVYVDYSKMKDTCTLQINDSSF